MAEATQKAGGPLVNSNIPPGMSYDATTGTWTAFGNTSQNGRTHIFGASGNASTNIYIRAAAGTNRELAFQTDGSIRASFGLDGTAESGGDAGSILVSRLYTDAGAQVDVWLSIPRASGSTMTLGGSTKRTLATTGGRIVNVTVVTDTLTLDSTHHSVVCNKATAMTVNLPAVASHTGREYIISNKNTGVVTVDANASELIGTVTTKTLNQGDSLTIHSDGAIWVVV